MRVARSVAGCLTVLSRRCLGVRSVPMTESYFKSSRFMFDLKALQCRFSPQKAEASVLPGLRGGQPFAEKAAGEMLL